MGQIEREIKLLNVDVMKIKNTLHEKGIEPKGKYIQDVYTYDLLTVDGFYKKYIDEMINNNDFYHKISPNLHTTLLNYIMYTLRCKLMREKLISL